jgi:subtilisin family serine protease
MRVSYRYGGREGAARFLQDNDDLLVVRTREAPSLREARLSPDARRVLDGFDSLLRFRAAGVDVLRVRTDRPLAQRDRARDVLGKERALRFAGRVLTDPRLVGVPAEAKEPVVYTENLFVQFDGSVRASAAKSRLRGHELEIKREVPYLRNAYFVGAREGAGAEAVFARAERLLEESGVLLCHPELVRRRSFRKAFPQQWHLQATRVGGRRIDAHANVVSAWRRSRGSGVTIAIIDDGFDLEHEELRSRGKIRSPRDITIGSDDPRPGNRDDHGTACAGMACADGRRGASGVAPAARLMPIRLVSALGSQDEADAFAWAADHGADVISCSWGPIDGPWWDEADPRHQVEVPLPDSTRLAIDYAVTQGRKGRGCVVVWAAGNGNESVDNDGYASYEKVIAVAACNDHGTRSVYSDFGDAIWCSFPSSDLPAPGRPDPLTPGLWTIDRSGKAGYNPGGPRAVGDARGNYTPDFGGTSGAAPGVAGVAALVLSRHPSLAWHEVRDVLRATCTRIDPDAGSYGTSGRSALYGYGRVDAARALEEAASRRQAGRRRRSASRRRAK